MKSYCFNLKLSMPTDKTQEGPVADKANKF